MSRYDEAKGSLQNLYDAACEELEALNSKREELVKMIEILGPIYGNRKTYSVENLKAAAPMPSGRGRKPSKEKKEKEVEAASGKHERIKEARIRELVTKCLEDAAPDSMTAIEISNKLEKEGLPSTKSFKTRVYGLLSTWVKDGLLTRPGRGVYRLAEK